MEKLSSTLKHLLNEAKISEAELARRTGIAQPMVNRLATGKNKNPKLETLKPIAKYFSVTFSQLLGEEEMPLSEQRNNTLITDSQHKQPFELSLLQLDNINPGNLKSESIIATTTKVSEDAFAVRINNNNYEPRFSCDTVLIVEPNSEPTINDLALVYDENTKKTHFVIIKNNLLDSLKVQDLNSTQFEFTLSNNHKILGVIVQAKHNYK